MSTSRSIRAARKAANKMEYADAVLSAFDSLPPTAADQSEHAQRRNQREHRAEVERRSRNRF